MSFESQSHQPRKRFGQHFLHDQRYIDHIIDALEVGTGMPIIEIGPGEGALTYPLLKRAKSLTAIEIDRDLVPRLRARAPEYGALEVIESDVLQVDFNRFASQGAFKVAGNLPYNVSTPLLFHVLQYAEAIERMVFMLQKEVVDRMAAEPGSKVYGRLSVMLQARCAVEPLFDVPPEAFRPPPKVDSAVVRLWPKARADIGIVDVKQFELVVRAAFAQRRKTLRNALREVCDANALTHCGIEPEARAETIAVADFIRLSNELSARRQELI